jgi:hypothetical protein
VVNKIGFQFHTPFVKGDPLWLPFGQERNKVVDNLIALREKYPDFVINSKKQLFLMKGNWGYWNHTNTMPFMGNPLFRSYGKRKETLLYRECR